ncbi:MAG TPA: hypothetical protein VJ850_11950 [Candidatus Limnocylindrales bacterium]|nr:hypothetical protein [Candidatus Limnocylindrales bacterium]
MSDPLEGVLKLVAEGRLTPEEAAPIIDALGKSPRASGPTSGSGGSAAAAGFAATGPTIEAGTDAGMRAGEGQTPRYARVEVRENGRRVVDLRIPISLGRFALSRVPGLSKEQIAEVEDAVSHGAHGPILDIQDGDGDGVRIVLE